MTTVTPFLMFQNATGRQALDFYIATVPDSRIVSMELFADGEPGPAGTIKRATVELAGQRVMVHDSFIQHGFGFTPSFSLFIDCADAAEAERLFGTLSQGGHVLMPLSDYGWSESFGWVGDRFGVSWQISFG